MMEKTPLWRINHIIGNEFITILLEEPLSEKNRVDQEIQMYLEKMLQKAGICSYVITSALRRKPASDEIKGNKTNYFIKNDSGWFEEIIKPAREQGQTADVIVPFGAALYQITKTGSDFNVMDLIYPGLENYVYVGNGWIGDYDCFLFPQFNLYDIFCPGSRDTVELQSWKMNFMITVFGKIANREYQLPEDLSRPELKEIGECYTEDKEKAIQEVKDFLNEHKDSEVCAFDLETSGFNQWKDKIRCITLAFDTKTGYYLEWKIFAENKELLDLLSQTMLSCKHRVTVNGKFDIKFLWVNGLSQEVKVTEDAMLLSHVLCSGRKKGLKTQAFYWTPHGGYDHKLDVYLASLKAEGIKDPSYYDIPKKILLPYATMDAVMTVRVWLEGLKRIHKFDKEFPTEKPASHTGGRIYTAYEWYQYIMMLYPIICTMEFEGLYIDEHILEMHRELFKKRSKEQRDILDKIFNVKDYDYESTTQLGKLLEEAGWACHGKSKIGGYETSNECFIEWQRDNEKGVDNLIKLRKSNICLNTYLGTEKVTVNQKTGSVKKEWSGWPQYIIKHDDGSSRIHCNFSVCGTKTFRMISTEPNLQNVPTHSTEGSITKMCFTVPPACMAFVHSKATGHVFEVTQLGVINTERGYVASLALNENDVIVETEETVLEYDEWSKKGIDPVGIETMQVVCKNKDKKPVEGDHIYIEYDMFNKKAGKLCYLMMTQDAASLEARVVTSDTALNKSGMDPILKALYDPEKGSGDLHSQTAFNTFCKSIDLQINEIEDDDGKTWLLIDNQPVKINRGGTEMVVKGSELQETDKIVSYVY